MAPRPGLTADRVVDAAVAVVEDDGLDGLTLGRVAARLGVRTPSLYNHVDGLGDVRREVTVRAIEALGDALQRATVGRSGGDAVRAMAEAYRRFALDHPGLYAATVPTTEVDDEQAIHAARSVRAAVHGFLALELAGGFGLDVPTADSFAWMVGTLAEGIAEGAGAAVSSGP